MWSLAKHPYQFLVTIRVALSPDKEESLHKPHVSVYLKTGTMTKQKGIAVFKIVVFAKVKEKLNNGEENATNIIHPKQLILEMHQYGISEP